MAIRLFIAGSTPGSVRAEHHVIAALAELDQTARAFDLEIIDVFTNPKRALSDGVIVTPTLMAQGDGGPVTFLGDFADEGQLVEFFEVARAVRQ